MYLFLAIYGVLALTFFIFLEVFSIIQCKEDNKMFKIPVYRPNHFRTLVCALFFPIVILIVLISVITELILERSK